MKKLFTILILYLLLTTKLIAQESSRDVPFSIEAGRDTTIIIPLDKSNCISTTNFHSGFLSIAQQAPFFYISLSYLSNCGTTDFMKIEIISDTLYLIQADTGSLATCACEYGYSIIFHNYQQDSCIVVFGDTSAVYYNPAAALKENIANINNVLIRNSANEILQIDIINNSEKNASYSMELYEIEGKLIRVENLNNLNNIFDIRNLNKGIYLVRIKKNGIDIKSEKFIKI